ASRRMLRTLGGDCRAPPALAQAPRPAEGIRLGVRLAVRAADEVVPYQARAPLRAGGAKADGVRHLASPVSPSIIKSQEPKAFCLKPDSIRTIFLLIRRAGCVDTVLLHHQRSLPQSSSGGSPDRSG